ncbi:TPA: hypothetical protein MW242_002900 [Acinetobacter baumannii]|nr:hypothetical protein [Acinetobacter baumannii]
MTTDNRVERVHKPSAGCLAPFALIFITFIFVLGFYFFYNKYGKSDEERNIRTKQESNVSHTPNQNDLSAKDTAILVTGTLLTTTKTTDLGNGKVQVDIDYPGWKKCTVKLEASNNPQTSAYLVSESSCKKTELKND